MPITKSAKKAIRVAAHKRVFNLRRSKAMKDSIKEVRQLVSDGKSAEASALLSKAYKAIDKAAKRGVIKPNAAARRKSRVAKLLSKK